MTVKIYHVQFCGGVTKVVLRGKFIASYIYTGKGKSVLRFCLNKLEYEDQIKPKVEGTK